MKLNQDKDKSTIGRRVLVIGGRGYIGRHIARHLRALGADVIVGTRGLHVNLADDQRIIALHKLPDVAAWSAAIEGVDTVINAVGILRQRFDESYEQVHHLAIAALAEACKLSNTKLIHVSALGLNSNQNSRFMLSKLRGEAALRRSGANWHIVRPSVVDGRGGYGAKWFRRVAAWPIHPVPANATGRMAPIDIDDLGEAIARLALKTDQALDERDREFDLGGPDQYGLLEYLDALAAKPAIIKANVPVILAKSIALLCDLFHVTPYSYGHYELLKFDNLPNNNRITELLGRPAKRIGVKRTGPQKPPATIHNHVEPLFASVR